MILIASADLPLSQLRKRVLEQEPGYKVTVSRNKQHALALLHSERFDILLLCNSVAYRTRLEFATKFRQRNPDGKILAFEGREQGEIDYDLLLEIPSTPQELLKGVRKLVDSRPPVDAGN